MLAPSPQPPATGDCAALLASLNAVACGGADAVTAARVEAHVEQCAPCRAALAAARAYRRVMRRVGAAMTAPVELRERVLTLLRGARGSRTP